MSGQIELADLIVIALGVVFGAFCIWLIVQFVNRPERLRSWTKDPQYQSFRRALSVIIVAGMTAICTGCLLTRDDLNRYQASHLIYLRIYMQTIALTALPTVFFVAAFLMSSTSARKQRAIARTAALFGILSVIAALAEIWCDSLLGLPDWFPLVGTIICWLIGMVVSVGLLLVAGARLAWRGWCRVVSAQADESGRQ